MVCRFNWMTQKQSCSNIIFFAIFEIIIEDDQINNSLGCITNGGNKPNTPCVFPFNFKGTVYKACTGIEHTTFWCSTKVDDDGNHVDGKWGNCGPACRLGKNLNS